jgi:CubicO group peptidase (beta-lactamase class C family)
MATDTLFRIASMTKPVTSVAVMMLADEGKLQVTDPVSKYLPEFRSPKVLPTMGSELVPAKREITIHDLLTHTSGINYRFASKGRQLELYREAGINDGLTTTDLTLAENVRRLAGLPLAHQPGAAWTYGLNTDVLGRVVEVASGQDLETFVRERICKPLRMNDTSFTLPPEKRNRLAALYKPTEPDKTIERVGDGLHKINELIYAPDYPYHGAKAYPSGGAGLVSTAADYSRFLRMLLNGGELDGARVLKPETVRQMTRDQLGGLDNPFGVHGGKFGYGFGIVTEGGKSKSPASVGSYSWGGIWNTFFWVDPEKQVVGVVMTQLYPNGHLGLGAEFQKRAYEALAPVEP